MGLLDDAIREHLELKRRHGADPSEVERQEQEALGPARRGAAPTADAELDSGAASVGTLDEDGPGVMYDDEFEDEYELPAASVPAAAPPLRDEPENRFAVDREPRDEPDDDEDRPPFAAEPSQPAEPPAERRLAEPEDLEPVPERRAEPEAEAEAEAEPADADAEPAESEDVLEETPEFLQETPEHDRLWFEQKPPRDFEF